MTALAQDRAPAAQGPAGAPPFTPADIRTITRHAARADRRHPWNLVGHLDGQFLDIWADRTGVTARICDKDGTRTGSLRWRDLDRAPAEPVQDALWELP